MSAASSPSTTFLLKSQSPIVVSLLSIPDSIRFPLQSSTFSVNPYKCRQFSSQHPYSAVSPEEEEESAIGDCLVYEEGIFDDPSLESTRNFRDDYAQVSSRPKTRREKDATVSPENLVPEEWLKVQKELHITKKERRFISQQMEYGRKVENRRQSLKPINLEEYEKFKQEKLKQLNPVILDYPKFEQVEENEKQGKSEDRKNGEEKSDRVVPRNPRLAVYGGGLEDVSAFFSSGRYDPAAAADKTQGTRKLFSKEEKLLMNRRVPDLAVASSGKWHPLHTLAAAGEFYLVNSLLKHSLDINAPDKNGLTAIHKAILAKKQAVFNFLLRESTNPFVLDEDGATLMHYAVFTASDHMIKILLLYNVDINLQDNDGWTPLHLAVQSRRTDIVRLLLIKGADRSLKNQDGLTALDLCLYSGRDTRTYELIRLLKQHR